MFDVENKKEIEKFGSLLSESKRIVLIGPINPDGDCIGSIAGMMYFFKAAGMTVQVVIPNSYPDFLNFLVDKESIKSIINAKYHPVCAEKSIKVADLIICMDLNALSRIDDIGKAVEVTKSKKVLIDHHPQPNGDFDIVFSDPALSSASELTYWIIKELSRYFNISVPDKSKVSLYTGMMTDTNNFANSVVSSTFKMASELLEAGVDKEFIQRNVFSGFSEARMRLMGYMLYENMKIIPELHASVMIITKEIKDKFKFSEGDSEGFVNLGLNIKEVSVAALFTESEDFVRVSLRSKGNFSVNALSRAYFNGGGHERAAGGRVKISINDIGDYFEQSLKKFIEENNISMDN